MLTYVQQGRLDDLSQFLDLLLAATHIAVSNVGLVLHLHHGHRGIDLGRQGNMNLVLVAVHSYSHALLNVRGSDGLGQFHDELGELFHIDDVLGIVRVGVNNLSAACHLQRLFILQRLLVRSQIPQCRGRQSGIALLDASQLIDLFDGLLDVVLDGLDALVVLALSLEDGMGGQERDTRYESVFTTVYVCVLSR